MNRKSLTDILRAGNADTLRHAWDATQAAEDYAPLPAGEYVAHVAGIELFNAKSGTPGVKLTFRILDGEHAGRLVWHDCWLTEAALPMTKRDLAKLGITSPDQLDRPLPKGIRCAVRVALRTDDDGSTYNRVRSFDFIGIDEPERDPFAPDDAGDLPNADAEGGPTP